MAYCDSYDIASSMRRFEKGFTLTTKPTNAEVDVFCEQVSTEIDAVLLSVGVNLPLVASQPILLAKSYAIIGAQAKTLRSAEMEPARQDAFQKLFDDKLKFIKENPAMFSDPAQGTDVAPGIKTARGPSHDDRRFTMEDKRNW